METSDSGLIDTENERKTVLLATLTLLMYAFISFSGNGPLAFFPINELAFFCVTVYFLFRAIPHFKLYPNLGWSFLVFGAVSLLSLLQSQLFMSFVLNEEAFQKLVDGPLLDVNRLVIYSLLLLEVGRISWLSVWKWKYFLVPVVFLLFVAAIYFTNFECRVLGLLVVTAFLQISYRFNEETAKAYPHSLFYLWVFYTFLNLTYLLTMYLYDLRFE